VRAPLLLVAVAAIVALPGCGSLGANDAEQTVKDFAKATSEGDGDKFCHDLVSREYLEKTTLATGDKAADQCVDQIKAAKGFDVKVTKITKTKVDGDRATVTAELEYQGTKRPQVFRLEKEDGRFKLVAATQ
jgi:hypothetical protein